MLPPVPPKPALLPPTPELAPQKDQGSGAGFFSPLCGFSLSLFCNYQGSGAFEPWLRHRIRPRRRHLRGDFWTTPNLSARPNNSQRNSKCTTRTATRNATYPCHIVTSTLALQNQHRNPTPDSGRTREMTSTLRWYISAFPLCTEHTLLLALCKCQ